MAEDGHDEPEQPRFWRDCATLGLLACTVFITVSVVTRHPADPITPPVWPISELYHPDQLVFPQADRVQNACGRLGALLAGILFDNLGMATAIVVAAMGGSTAALLIRGSMNAPVLRSFGGTLTLPAAASVAALMPMTIDGMPVMGNGGTLGAMTSTWLLDHFAPAGAWILTLTTLAVGLLLVTDYALLYAGRRIVDGGRMVSVASVRRAAAAMPIQRRRRQPFTDLESPIELDGEDPTPDLATVGASSDPRHADRGSPTDEGIGEEDPDHLKIKLPAAKPPASKSGIGAAAASAAAGLAAAAGLSGVADALSDDAASEEYEEDYDGDGSWEEDEYEDDADETVEVEFEGETIQVREDDPHDSVAEPRIKAPKPPKKKAPDERQRLLDRMVESAPAGVEEYHLPSVELLIAGEIVDYEDQRDEIRRKATLLERTFKDFGFNIKVVEVETGPVIAQYEIELEPGLRLSKITGLADDVAIALRVPSVRIVAPIPGKNTVGIEVPNENRQAVRIRDVIEQSDNKSDKMNIPVFLGQDVSGNPLVVDLAKMPHLLIAGRTGTGKSVCLNAIICSVLMCCRPDEVRMLMIDPKMVELSGYGRLPHLMHPVITDMKKAEAILAWAVEKMEERYSLLAKVGVRHINSFNDLGRDEVLRRMEVDEDDGATDVPDKLPFIVIVADEMADLMMTAGKDVEQHIIRLAQKSRAVGIHLILATQKPTVDVITGLIKSNLPARLSFQVASKTDSRVVLDENGADKLLGNGDMLFLWPGTSTLIRGQGTYLEDSEIDAICAHCSTTEQTFVGELMNLKVDEEGEGAETSIEKIKQRDELYDSAIEVVIREGRGSCSLLQRCLGIGYGRAAKLIDFMAEDGIVGEYNGSKAREVVMTMPQWLEMQGLSDQVEGSREENTPPAPSQVVPSKVESRPAAPPRPKAASSPPANISIANQAAQTVDTLQDAIEEYTQYADDEVEEVEEENEEESGSPEALANDGEEYEEVEYEDEQEAEQDEEEYEESEDEYEDYEE